MGNTGTQYLHVPHGQLHHDVEGGSSKDEVEEGVAVGHALTLISDHFTAVNIFTSTVCKVNVSSGALIYKPYKY